MPVTTLEAQPGFGARAAETGEEIKLAMQRLWLTGRILPVGARLMVHHTFQSAEPEPVEIVYAFMLPRDAALRRFRINGEGFSVRSELKPTAEATAAYERAVEKGSLAALVRQYGDGVVNLNVGNLRPGETVTVNLEIIAGVEVRDDGLRFRFPFALAPSYHRQARAVEAEPGAGEMELPEEEFGDVILPRFMRDASHLHAVGFDLAVKMAQPVAELASPSHGVRTLRSGDSAARVLLAAERDVPDRDLVLDVRTEAAAPGLLAGRDSEGRTRFAAVVPSGAFGKATAAPRRIALVLDRSGSMGGAPMTQARRAVEACLGALAAEDLFTIVAFDDRVENLSERLTAASRDAREKARKFLAGVDARGGTELELAIETAVGILNGAGDVLVLTDGQVFGTERILERARSARVRIHCLGIGSASQDRFLTMLARETGGQSRFLTPRERVDLPAVDLFASIGRPVAGGVSARVEGGAIEPAPREAVFTGAPLVVFGECGSGAKLEVRWDGGCLDVPVVENAPGETLRLIQGARLITDLDGRIQTGAARKRQESRLEKRLEELSRTFGLASRAMSLVAVVERAGDQPGALPKTVVVPVGVPQDVRFGAYFGAQGRITMASLAGALPSAPPAASGVLGTMLSRAFQAMPRAEAVRPVAEPPADPMFELAAAIEPDGGMPGRDDEDRLLRTIAALLVFLAEGNTPSSGPFRSHVQRLIAFLEHAAVPRRQPIVDRVLEIARGGQPVPRLGGSADRVRWEDIERAL